MPHVYLHFKSGEVFPLPFEGATEREAVKSAQEWIAEYRRRLTVPASVLEAPMEGDA